MKELGKAFQDFIKRNEKNGKTVNFVCSATVCDNEENGYEVLDGGTYMRGPAGVLIHHVPELVNRLNETVDESKFIDDFTGN